MTRDDFPEKTKRIIAGRVNYMCSNPTCYKFTQKPDSTNTNKVLNLGVAAHIAAASPNGPRYDPKMNREERISADNGIWLCLHCATVIDRETEAFNIEILSIWKRIAEMKAARACSLKEDGIQLIINEIDNASNKLNCFLDKYELNDPSSQYLKEPFFQIKCIEADYRHNYNKHKEDFLSQMSYEYTRTVYPDIQNVLVKCKIIIGRFDINIIDDFKKLEYSYINQSQMRDMLPILHELKTIISWR